MNEESIGGVTLADVVRFQIKIMMGAQYARVVNAPGKEGEKDIIVACLRLAWNDAFRHVTKNRPEKEIKNNLEGKTLDEYICGILSDKMVYDKFIVYANSIDTKERVEIIKKSINDNEFFNMFNKVKDVYDNERPLCFGHIQKLFNMAIKYYLCLYFCREYLNLDESYFAQIKMAALETADCPIDSIILRDIGMNNVKWSKIGIDENENAVKNYTVAQEKIKEDQKNKGNSNMAYDFKFWQLK